MSTQDLNWVESLLYRLITAPSGVAEGLAREKSLDHGGLARIIAGDERLSPEDRVDIYANMYFYRVLDVLKEDFPATLATIGPDRFHNLVTSYLIVHPPAHFSIGQAGRHLADFLCDYPLREDFPFIPDLARLERALIESFHAADAAPLDAARMRVTPPEQWPAVRLKLHPTIVMLPLQWNVSEILKQVEDGEQPHSPTEREAVVLVWRNGNRVFYRAIDAIEHDALVTMGDGTTFAEVCDAIASGVETGDPMATINRLFERWLSDGILVSG
jgi:hypothetical protein